MSTFSVTEAKSSLGTLLAFFWGELFGEFDHVNVHGIGVLGGSGGQGKRLEGLSRPPTSLDNLFYTIPLVLEVGGFQVPVINFIWDCVEGHDLLHKWGGDSGSKETYEDVVVHDAGTMSKIHRWLTNTAMSVPQNQSMFTP